MSQDLLSENHDLRRRLKAFVAQARQNEQIMRRFQEQELRLIGVESLNELVRVLLHSHRTTFDLDAVTLTLVDPDYEIRRTLAEADMAGPDLAALQFQDDGKTLRLLYGDGCMPRLGHFRREHHGCLFPNGPLALGSVALLPLVRNGSLIGSLNLGSLDQGRFVSGTATDFMERLAAIAAICLENALNNERLKHMGLTDPLTGVYNRRYFDQRLLEEVGRVLRQGSPLSCLFLDIDYFKRINDTHGHQTGDRVLKAVACRIKAQLRLSDALARYGGEEFSVLLVQTGGADALEIAERIRQSIGGHPFPIDGTDGLAVSLSIGVAVLDDGDRSVNVETAAQQLVAQADQNLYRAKQSGRNRVVCCAPCDCVGYGP